MAKPKNVLRRTPKVLRPASVAGEGATVVRIVVLAAVMTLALVGCAVTQTVVPLGARSTHLGASWMAAGLKNQDLLYGSNGNGLVNVYLYQQHKLVGVLTDFTDPMGECVDGAGDVYITDYQAQTIDEYAHGSTKQLRAISDSYKPYGCAVDPKTGDLAVANFGETYEAGLRSAYVGEGNLAIYVHAKGQPIYYGTRFQHFSACAYDKYGDLLAASIDGYSGNYSGEFDYMPAKSKNFAEITLPGPESSWYWGESPAVGWDGKYWLVDSYGLYRYSINIKAQYVDTVSLSGEGTLGPVWLYRKTPHSAATQIVGTSDEFSGSGYVTYWKYPAGGSPIYQTSKDLYEPYGVAVSLKS